jgi:hypothetical protein
LEPVKELPRECVSLKEWGERDGVEDGGHAGVEAMYRVIRRLNNSHSGLQSCCGAFQGAGDVYMSPQSSLDSSFSVFMDPNLPAMRKNLAELKEFEDESEMSKKGRLYDVKGIEGILIFLQDLSKRGKIQLSQRLQSNLEDALSVCRKANSGSFMARVHQALECAKEICVLSLCTDPSRYDGSGHVVCLKGEKIRCVAQEWLEKNRHCQVQYDTMLLFPTPFTFSHSCCIL